MKRITALLLAVLMLLALCAGCGDKKEENTDGEKVFTVGTTYSHLYMYTAGSGESDNYCRRLVYDQLFYIDDLTGEMSSDIAESELVANIVYKEVYGAAISTLVIPVLSKAFCEAHPDGDDAWWYSPVGSGPYKVGEVVMGTSVEFVRRDDYWNSEASFPASRIVVKYYSDTTAEYADYVAGQLDAIIALDSTQVDQLRQAANTEVVVQSANDVCMLAFNNNTVDPAVREAIAYGVDWDAVALAGYGNLYTPATSHYATTFEAYTDHSGAYTYDVEKAKQILADAGISGLEFAFPCFAGSSDAVIGEALQSYLSVLGIGLTINEMDIPTLIPTLISGGGDLSLQSTAANGNAPKEVNTVVSPLASNGFQIMAIADEDFNALLAQGLNTTDNAKRVEVYKQVDQWLYDNNQVIPICERGEAFCYNNAKIASFSMASVNRGSLAFVTFK